MESEIWKDIKGYEGIYQISNFGRVKSLPRKIKMRNQYSEKEMILKPQINRYGYYTVNLVNGKISNKNCTIHRLVAIAFIPNPDNKIQVNHINGDKKNNNVNNLEWNTPKENTIHALKSGLKKKFRNKAVLQFDKNGNFIREWNCISDIKVKHISDVCKGKRKTAGGFIWKYKGGFLYE